MVKCALFDFDGTLAQSEEYMAEALDALLRARGRPPMEKTATLPPGGARTLLKWAGFGEHELEDAKRELWECYEGTDYRQTKLFPDVANLLSELEKFGWTWGVVTNKPARYFFPITVNLGWENNPALVTGNMAGGKKPNPDGLIYAAGMSNAPVRRCVYVGDERKDGQAAQAAGMPFIWAKWGSCWNPQQQDMSALISGVASAPADVLPLAHKLIQAEN